MVKKLRVKLAIGVCAVVASVVAIMCACTQTEATAVTLPADHISATDSTQIDAAHQNCASCHDSLVEGFSTSGDLMSRHMEILTDYLNGETTAETDRIMTDNLDVMKAAFSADTLGNCITCHTLELDAQGRFQIDITFNDFCIQCHDDYDYIIEQTKDWGVGTPMWDYRLSDDQPEGQYVWEEYTSYEINPHIAHGTNAKCGDCHKIHQETESFYCTQCHIWAMPGDDGSEQYSDWGYDLYTYRNWRSDNQYSPNEMN